MNLSLLVLDGPLKNFEIPLKEGYVFSQNEYHDQEMENDHALSSIDHNLSWKINGLNGSKIRVGLEEKAHITLIPDLIFHIGQTGFKVIPRGPITSNPWEQKIAEIIGSNEWSSEDSKSYFLLNAVQLLFQQGPQAGEILTLSYGPRELGHNNLDLNLKDPSLPRRIVSFKQVGDRIEIESLLTSDQNGKLLLQINGTELTENPVPVQTGDLLKIGTNILEISFLK